MTRPAVNLEVFLVIYFCVQDSSRTFLCTRKTDDKYNKGEYKGDGLIVLSTDDVHDGTTDQSHFYPIT